MINSQDVISIKVLELFFYYESIYEKISLY